MKTKSEAQLFLERPEKLDAIINNKLVEKQMWRDLALGITAQMGGERVQSSGSKSRMADAVERCIDVETEIDSLVDELIAIKKNVVETIEQLDVPMEYKVLHDRYIKYMSFYEIADKYGKDYSWATTTHGRALKSLQTILSKERT